jgi:hypothetical protein
MIWFYIDLVRNDAEMAPYSTCNSEDKHFADLCFIVSSNFFTQNRNSRIVLHLIAAIVFLLSGGFAFPVLNLFRMQATNFLTGQTTIERLGKQ